MRLFEFGDLVDVLECQRDMVEAIEKALATEVVDFKRSVKSLAVGNRLRWQIDGQLVARIGGNVLVNLFHFRFGQSDWQHAVLRTIVVKNIGVGFGDHAAESKIVQRPDGMLATGSIAKVLSGDEN